MKYVKKKSTENKKTNKQTKTETSVLFKSTQSGKFFFSSNKRRVVGFLLNIFPSRWITQRYELQL